MTVYWILVIAGALIVIGLGIYAGRLLFLLQAQNNRQSAVRDKRIDTITDSVQTIAFAMQQQQCDLSEGVIRLWNLLEAIPILPHPNFQQHYPGVYELYSRIQHFPTLDARQALTKQQRREQDKEREQIESELASKVAVDVDKLRHFNAHNE
ncbi:DUF2489 domain-containing protein [Agaribacter marinus]|uniref:Coproporphyrinogen III oxidase n=1 Tax=Agaribacter marinus TaxID=1431249 RepID=A0AA37WHM2_9ALTE|nr:DUF2489 domain-containing protein [Agaribacter marinus]GLR71251.1 coproporphyrinogen III oxidase [Agaribacter marinus]